MILAQCGTQEEWHPDYGGKGYPMSTIALSCPPSLFEKASIVQGKIE
jgi:hypothetical protein